MPQFPDRELQQLILKRYSDPFSAENLAAVAKRLEEQGSLSHIDVESGRFSWKGEGCDIPVLKELFRLIATSADQSDSDFCALIAPYLHTIVDGGTSPLWSDLNTARRKEDSPSTLEHIFGVLHNLDTDAVPHFRVILRMTVLFHDTEKRGELLAKDPNQDHATLSALRWRRVASQFASEEIITEIEAQHIEWLIANHHLAEQIDKLFISSSEAVQIIGTPEKLELLERFTLPDLSGNLRFMLANLLAFMAVHEQEASAEWRSVVVSFAHTILDLWVKIAETLDTVAESAVEQRKAFLALFEDLGMFNLETSESRHDQIPATV